MLYCIKYTDRHRSQITSSRAPVGAKNLLCALHYITWVALNKINASMTLGYKKARNTKGANWIVRSARDGLA